MAYVELRAHTAFSPRSFVMPAAFIPYWLVSNDATPSMIAVSTTCPRPERCLSNTAHMIPYARYRDPPP